MHIFFSGIGGTGIGPLALIAKEAGYDVSGSDKQDSLYIDNLKEHGLNDIHIGQSAEAIAKVHARKPIDWFVYSSALPNENPSHPELIFARENLIKHSKRDELLNEILSKKSLKLVAIAGTHGKTTTTAMVIWLFKQLGMPVSYSVGAKIGFGDMGAYDPKSEYFVYECDEFDRNFLAFEPYLSLITGVTWDHHEVYPTRDDYQQAFSDFIGQSKSTLIWQEDAEYLSLPSRKEGVKLLDSTQLWGIELAGFYNRMDGQLAAAAVHQLAGVAMDKLRPIISAFPGVSRRMEEIAENLYSDYAHTPEKIKAAMDTALEMTDFNYPLVVVYEPLTNRRMHYMAAQHSDIFKWASKLYWVPSYLAREDPDLPVLTPEELIKNLSPEVQSLAKPMKLDDELERAIRDHLDKGDMVLCMSGGGGGSLDEWLRARFGNR